MTRWRETLCGKVVPQAAELTMASPATVVQGTTPILSCGGSFLPHPQRHRLRAENEPAPLFHLPKEKYEVVILRTEEELEYYSDANSDLADELDRIENVLHDTHHKFHN